MKVLTLFMLFSASFLHAQETIYGQLVNSEGIEVIGAHLTLVRDSSIIGGTVSNEFGAFEIDMARGDHLNVSMLGYENQQYTTEEVLHNNLIILHEMIYELDMMSVVSLGFESVCKCRTCGGCFLIPLDKETPFKDSNTNKSKWTYYPNPTFGNVQVEAPEDKEGIIEVFSLSGKLITRSKLSQKKSVLNFVQYPGGTYFLRFKDNTGTEEIGQLIKVVN